MQKTSIVVLLLFMTTAFVQEAKPTKEQTVNYLNRTVNDVVDHKDGNSTVISSLIVMKDNLLTYFYKVRTNTSKPKETYWQFEFNPRYIVSVSLDKPWVTDESSIRRIKILFSGNVCIKKHYSPSGYAIESVNQLYVAFLYEDEQSFEKIKKAFMHLKDLMKAEDPF